MIPVTSGLVWLCPISTPGKWCNSFMNLGSNKTGGKSSSCARIYVAGHTGMVGAAIVQRLRAAGWHDIITRSHSDLDLLDQAAVDLFFQEEHVDRVILAAARVGGILANNTYPADFIYQNLVMETNVIHSAWQAGVGDLVFLGSSCIYPGSRRNP